MQEFMRKSSGRHPYPNVCFGPAKLLRRWTATGRPPLPARRLRRAVMLRIAVGGGSTVSGPGESATSTTQFGQQLPFATDCNGVRYRSPAAGSAESCLPNAGAR